MDLDLELIKKLYNDYNLRKFNHDKMYNYYKGQTDAMKNYKMVTSRSNNKINTNFLKKYVKEEISYSFGLGATYVSKSNNTNAIKSINYYTSHWSENHNTNLAKSMLIHSIAYELYYLDKKNRFCAKVISPRNGYAYVDNFGNVVYFLHVFTKQFDTTNTTYVDVYTDNMIYHFDSGFNNQMTDPNPHYFGQVPVGIAIQSEELEADTIYTDIKGLQDSYETNLSDISNEISDFRQAYLKLTGVDLTPEQADEMKEMGIIKIKGKDGNADWLIKSINDSFIQNTLNTIEDKMYQLSSHINHNEKMQSNLSGVALRSRLISLEEKCKLNQNSVIDCVKTRLEMLFIYLDKISVGTFDVRDIKVTFTPNIPIDTNSVADMISKLGDRISTKTALAQLPFINDPAQEIEQIKKEQSELSLGSSLLGNKPNVGDINGQL